MCGTPERNLASTLSKMMSRGMNLLQEYENVSSSNQELRRQEKLMKELATEAKQEREEEAIKNKGTLNANSAGSGIDSTSGTMKYLKHKEEIDKIKDMEKIDRELNEQLRRSVAQRHKNSSSMKSSLFSSATGSFFNTLGGLFK